MHAGDCEISSPCVFAGRNVQIPFSPFGTADSPAAVRFRQPLWLGRGTLTFTFSRTPNYRDTGQRSRDSKIDACKKLRQSGGKIHRGA